MANPSPRPAPRDEHAIALTLYQAFRRSNDAMFYCGRDGTILDVNDAFVAHYGWSRAEAVGQNPRLIRSRRTTPETYKEMWTRILDPKIGFWRGELVNLTKDGREIPVVLTITSVRDEVASGDRLAPAAVRDFEPFVPHSPEQPLNGAVVSLYGDSLTGGLNQIVAINRGKRDGVERGHVLALWTEGAVVKDPTDPKRGLVKVPDERHGLLFVFRVFDRVSYALIVQSDLPVKPGDRFSKP